MHELSIALGIIDDVCDAAEKEGAWRIAAVNLRIGALSGISKDALLFAWDLACTDTLAAGSRLFIEFLPAALACRRCGARSEPSLASGFFCGACGGSDTQIISGRELEIVSMEVAA